MLGEVTKPAPFSRVPGGNHTKLYLLWTRIKARCYDPNASSYQNYGGRGITVCDRWRRDYLAFQADMGPHPGKGLSLDRIDNDGPYSPENCRWATASAQARNRGATKINLEIAKDIIRQHQSGSSKARIARQYGLSPGTVRAIIVGRIWVEALRDVLGSANLRPVDVIGHEAITKLSAAGFVVVPREPTQAMRDAADDINVEEQGPGGIWCAMLQAQQVKDV